MVDIGDMLIGYLVYESFIKDSKDKDDEERQKKIDEIMDGYGVDEDEAEEILDSM